MLDAKAFGAELAEMVRGAIAPITSRLDALEKRLSDMPAPRDGKDADPAEVAAQVASVIKADIDALRAEIAATPAPEMPNLPALIDGAVKTAVAAIPAPCDGKDADPEAVAGIVLDRIKADLDGIAPMVAKAVAEIPPAQDGKSVTPDDVLPALKQQVSEFLASIPAPQDGKSVTVEDVAPMIADAVEKAVAAIPAPADGVGLAGSIIDRDGNLVVTMTNGTVAVLGSVVGKDGDSGRDGLGFEDLSFDYDEHGRAVAKFQRGGVTKEVTLPGIVDRGPYRAGEAYRKGDAVSYGGSLWIAQSDTSGKPEGAGWRLAVKAGRNGRDGVLKPAQDRAPLKIGGGNAG